MITWLDRTINRRFRDPSVKCLLDVMMAIYRNIGLHEKEFGDGWQQYAIGHFAVLSLFCEVQHGGTVTMREPPYMLALSVPRDIFEDLWEAEPPPEAFGILEGLIGAHGAIYMDFGRLRCGDKDLQAIAITRVIATNRFCIYAPFADETCAVGQIWRQQQLGDDLPSRVTRLALCVASYYSTAPRLEDAPMVPGLHAISAQTPRGERREMMNSWNRASMFSVKKILPPSVPFRRREPASSHSGKISCRYQVRGHFRLQPCGAGRAQRRLIWIEAHARGPEGAQEKIPMYQV